MPPVVGFVYGIGSALAALFVTSASWAASVAIGSAVLALTVASARRAAKLDDPADAGYFGGQSVTVKSTEAPRNIVYGEANVGGVMTYVNSTGVENRELYFEIAHTGHEIDSFSGWFLDDKYIPAADVDVAGDGSVDTNTGAHGLDDVAAGPVLYLRGALGTSAQAVDSMLDTAFVDIGTNHRHRGCARSVIRCDLLVGYESKWNGRAPGNITAVIEGKKVYDPRLDTTFPGGAGAHRLATPSTWAWSDNPALIWADYRITAAPLGPGWDSARIDYLSVFNAANSCDTLVAIPVATTEKRFRCDLVVDASMEPAEVVSHILASMAGSERLYNGQWHVYAGVWQTPDFDLDESDLVGPIQFRKQPDTSSSDRYNQVKGEFFDRARQWKRSPFVSVNNTTLRSNRDNGRTLPKHLGLDGVSREYQAQRLAMRALNQADDAGILVFSAGYGAANIRIGDTGTVTISEFGWVAKSFRCVGVKAIDFLGYELKLKEDESGNYTDPLEAAYSTRTAAGTITFGRVNPWYLQGTPAIGWAADSEGKPAGVRASEGTTSRDQLSITNAALAIESTPDGSVGYCLPAIPVYSGKTYQLTIKHRSSSSVGDGLYIYFYERNSPLSSGKTHIINSDGDTTIGDTRDQVTDLSPAVSDAAMPGTTAVVETFTYTPNASAQFASLGFLNFNAASTVDYFVEWVGLTEVGRNVDLLPGVRPALDTPDLNPEAATEVATSSFAGPVTISATGDSASAVIDEVTDTVSAEEVIYVEATFRNERTTSGAPGAVATGFRLSYRTAGSGSYTTLQSMDKTSATDEPVAITATVTGLTGAYDFALIGFATEGAGTGTCNNVSREGLVSATRIKR